MPLFIHSAVDWTFEFFHFLVVSDNAAMNICGQILGLTNAFISHGWISWN
jgi:hypothetical protein